MLRIQRSVDGNTVTLVLSGRLRSEDTAQLERLCAAEAGMKVVVDLLAVGLVDRDGVRFLARSRAGGIEITNCPAYLREWIDNEGADT